MLFPDKPKKRKAPTKSWKARLLPCLLVVLAMLGVIMWIRPQSPYEIPCRSANAWMSVHAEAAGGTVSVTGPSLEEQVKANKVYHYSSPGVHQTLRWKEYKVDESGVGRNVWTIPPELIEKDPNISTATTWSADFCLPEGEYPGADRGKTSRFPPTATP